MKKNLIRAAKERTMFEALEFITTDSILGLMAAFRADPDGRKVDLGGRCVPRWPRRPSRCFESVRRAETALIAEQTTKTYVGPAGNLGFNAELEKLVFGAAHPALKAARIRTVQTPGGLWRRTAPGGGPDPRRRARGASCT